MMNKSNNTIVKTSCKSGGVLLFKAHQEPKSMHSIAKQYAVAVEAREDTYLLR